MAVKQVEIDGIGTVSLYKRHGNRSLRLSIDAHGEVRVTMPYWLPYKAGEAFAASKQEWIEKHRANHSVNPLTQGQSIGKAHRLYFEVVPLAERISTRLLHNEVRITYPPRYTPTHPLVQKAAKAAAVRALRKEAEVLLPQRLKSLAEQTGHNYASVSVKPLKTRWGSCSNKKEIILNIFLMQLPWHLIDYVLMHELTHTRVMRHGAPFWKAMEEYVPRSKQLRKEINAYHPTF